MHRPQRTALRSPGTGSGETRKRRGAAAHLAPGQEGGRRVPLGVPSHPQRQSVCAASAAETPSALPRRRGEPEPRASLLSPSQPAQTADPTAEARARSALRRRRGPAPAPRETPRRRWLPPGALPRRHQHLSSCKSGDSRMVYLAM